jgi:aspartate aminotransferase
MTISKKVEAILSKSSWIRKMFEEGAMLKAEHGPENVYDFSLGNPNLLPPEQFQKTLQDIIDTQGGKGHGYMPNTGYPEVRKSVADYLSKEQDAEITENHVIMTCGAAGGLNVIFKAILDPEDEVITPAPFFVEYGFYADNHGGKLITVPVKKDFALDIEGIANAVTGKTKAVLINSPNNPTGCIYDKDSLEALGNMLAEKGKELEKTIYLISDEPYRKIIYDDVTVPGIFPAYKDSIIVASYSKDLSISGERIGFIAVNPEISYKEALLSGMALANRILGFVNAPALMQKAISNLQGISVDISFYKRNRDLLCDNLATFGYEFSKPAGAFYLFPKTPIPDDVKFVQELQKELILTVPGSGFGGPGHFRIAFCVDEKVITGAMPGFKKVMEKIKEM